MPKVSSNPFTESIINELFWSMTGIEGEGMLYFKGNRGSASNNWFINNKRFEPVTNTVI